MAVIVEWKYSEASSFWKRQTKLLTWGNHDYKLHKVSTRGDTKKNS